MHRIWALRHLSLHINKWLARFLLYDKISARHSCACLQSQELGGRTLGRKRSKEGRKEEERNEDQYWRLVRCLSVLESELNKPDDMNMIPSERTNPKNCPLIYTHVPISVSLSCTNKWNENIKHKKKNVNKPLGQ